jgi:hypothetical protein
VAVFCGIAAIIVNYVLCRRLFGHSCALLSSLLIAAMPETIVNSRLGWDPCESILIDLFVVYGSLAVAQREIAPVRPIIKTCLACIIAFMIHPSNLFVDLLLPTAVAIRWAPEAFTYFTTGNRIVRCALAAVAVTLVIAGGFFALHRQITYERKVHSRHARNAVVDYAALFTGRDTYHWVAGYPEPAGQVDMIDVVSLLPWLFCAGCAVRMLAARGWAGAPDRLLAAGWLIETTAFIVIAGPTCLEGGNGRFGLCLIVPSVLLLVRSLALLSAERPAMQLASRTVVFGLSAALLASFYFCFFRCIMTGSGTAYEWFQTASTDPKLQAINYVMSQCPADEPCYLMCHSWWTYQPVRYFAMGHPNVHVPLIPRAGRAEIASSLRALKAGNFWTIDMINEQEHVRQELDRPGIKLTFIEVLDYSGRPIVIIGHPVPANGPL